MTPKALSLLAWPAHHFAGELLQLHQLSQQPAQLLVQVRQLWRLYRALLACAASLGSVNLNLHLNPNIT